MKGITLSEIWNRAIVSKGERELKVRDYAWASEMGMPLIDRYLKMNAVAQSNPPNERAKRKFAAGNFWEWIVWMVFNMAGVVMSKQEEVWTKDGDVWVKGKSDFLIGGTPDFKRARREMEGYPMPDDIKWFFESVLSDMEENFTEDIPVCIKELKSVSSFMMEKVIKTGIIRTHSLQLLHYKMGLQLDRASVVYVGREDCQLREFDIEDPETLKKQYYAELKVLRGYLDSKQQPPKEDLIVWDGKFSKNFGVEYSGYLTMIYGYNEPEDYRNEVSSLIARWNRVLKRVKEGAKMTDKNKDVIGEMERAGYNAQELADKMDGSAEEEEVQQ